ncbi:hypothetical protein [Lacipirellula sp.]|uniref:hypothetical protein n=1 Tax=Lacipirellula sp. TaxID=2691419 RepID=UPI003D0AC2E3
MSLSPQIGIWWDDGTTLVAITHAPESNSSDGTLIDSELNHFEEWERISEQFGLSPNDEYFEVPRGRVLLNRRTEEGIIYHGNATDLSRLQVISARFKLAAWKAQRNEHYDMGPDVDALFDDDFDD